MELGKFKTDISKSTKGTWIDIGDGGKLLIARIGNKNYKTAVRKGLEDNKKNYRSMTDIPQDIMDDITVEALVSSVLLDWKGIFVKGEEVIYTIHKCKELLEDPELEDFRDMVIELAGDSERFRQESIKEVKDNIKKS